MNYIRSRLNANGSSNPGGQGAARARLLRLLWSCMVLGLFAVVALVWLFGLTAWTIVIAAFVIACPAIAMWLLLEGRDAKQEPPRDYR